MYFFVQTRNFSKNGNVSNQSSYIGEISLYGRKLRYTSPEPYHHHHDKKRHPMAQWKEPDQLPPVTPSCWRGEITLRRWQLYITGCRSVDIPAATESRQSTRKLANSLPCALGLPRRVNLLSHFPVVRWCRRECSVVCYCRKTVRLANHSTHRSSVCGLLPQKIHPCRALLLGDLEANHCTHPCSVRALLPPKLRPCHVLFAEGRSCRALLPENTEPT